MITWPISSDTKKVRWIAEAATNGVLYKKVFFKISQNSQETPVSESAILLKKRLWYRCFLVNFAKFLTTPFFMLHLRGCLCQSNIWAVNWKPLTTSAKKLHLKSLTEFWLRLWFSL